MSSETLYLLLGGAIGLIASLVTTIVNNVFQSDRNKQTHIWELENQRRKEHLETLDRRIHQAEDFANRIAQLTHDIQSIIIRLVAADIDPHLVTTLTNNLNDGLEKIPQTIHLRLIGEYFDNPELSQTIHDLCEQYNKMMDLADSCLINLRESQTLDRRNSVLEAARISKELEALHGRFLRKLDEIRQQP